MMYQYLATIYPVTMIILIMGLNDREVAASVVVVGVSVVGPVVVGPVVVGLVVVVSVYAAIHAEISPLYLSNHRRFARTVSTAALAVARADPRSVSC
jgi:hypothetical protein